MARKFFYVCAGMLMLALSYHLGAGTAAAQATGRVVSMQALFAGVGGGILYCTDAGDLYFRYVSGAAGDGGPSDLLASSRYLGNLQSGPPVPAVHESWGQVKARYRTPAGGSVTPGADKR